MVASFDSQVAHLLESTSFNGDSEGIESRIARAGRYALCGQRYNALKCISCSHEVFRYPLECGLRGCRACGGRVRVKLVNRYLLG